MSRLGLWIAAIAIACLTACNYTEGQCWIQDEDNGGMGAGGGPIVPYGGGGYGNVPPEPQDADDPPPLECNSIGSYSASLFKFTTTLADDGADVGGGYQEATASSVKFVDGRQDIPASWSCSVWVGMAVRTASYGKISSERAAEIAAEVLTDASTITMRSRPSWVQALFCKQLAENMRIIFKNLPKPVAGSARAQ